MAYLPPDDELPSGNYLFSVRQSQQSNLHTTIQMHLWRMSVDGEPGAYELAGSRECLIQQDEVAAEEEGLTLTLRTHLTELGMVMEEDRLDAVHILMDSVRTEHAMDTAGMSMLVVMDIFEQSYVNIQIVELAETEVRMVPESEAASAGLDKVEVEEGAAKCYCAICLEKDDERFSRMPCTHVFHTECIERWLRIRNSCPICRYDMPVQD